MPEREREKEYVRDVNMSRVIRWPAIKWWV